jgi:hypothetical protein
MRLIMLLSLAFLRNIQEGEQAIAEPDQMHQGQPHASRCCHAASAVATIRRSPVFL